MIRLAVSTEKQYQLLRCKKVIPHVRDDFFYFNNATASGNSSKLRFNIPLQCAIAVP